MSNESAGLRWTEIGLGVGGGGCLKVGMITTQHVGCHHNWA